MCVTLCLSSLSDDGAYNIAIVVSYYILYADNVESEGPYAPERLLVEAIAVMRDKISVVRSAVAALEVGSGDVDMG